MLHVLDVEWIATSNALGTLVRYADDLVILCATRHAAMEAQRRVETILAPLGLRLHPDKTRIVHLARGAGGFDFLGFHHRKTVSRYRGRRYLTKWPSQHAMASIRAKIRLRTDRRFASRELHDVVADLNPVLRGWGAYFRYGNSSRTFAAIDEYVYWRMTKLARVKYATRGRLRTTRFTYVWLHDLGIHRLTGNVRSWALTHA